MTTRNQPLNEISSLLSGSQIANPGQMSSGTPQASVAGVDYTGLVNQQYQAQLANSQAGLGGLFGLAGAVAGGGFRSEEHTSELQSLMRISYAVFCLKKKNKKPLSRSHKETQQTLTHT